MSDVPTLKEAPAAAGAEARGRWTRAGIAAVVVAAGAVAATVVLRPFGTQAEEGGQAPAAVAPELGSLPAPAALPPEPAPAESSVNGESPEATVLPPARTPPKLPGRDAPGTPQRAVPVPSAAPSAAPATTEAAMGALGVWSNVSGRVSVDGSYVGDSPIPRIALRPGSHEVSIVTPDGSQQQSVDIRPGELAKIRFAF